MDKVYRELTEFFLFERAEGVFIRLHQVEGAGFAFQFGTRAGAMVEMTFTDVEDEKDAWWVAAIAAIRHISN